MRIISTSARSLTTITLHHLQTMLEAACDDDVAGVRIYFDTALIRRVETTERVDKANSASGAYWAADGTHVDFRVDADLSMLLADLRSTAKHSLLAQRENFRFWTAQQAHERGER